MKKIISITLILSALLSACSSQWQIDISDMPAELKAQHEEILADYLDKAEENPTDVDTVFEVAYRYQQLGQYKNAEEWYLKVLEIDPNHYVVYNNLADMYEEIEEYDLAAEAVKNLYQLRQDDPEAIKDTVRILLKVDDPINAQNALDNFMSLSRESGIDYTSLGSDLFDDIYNYRQEHSNE